MWRKFQRKEGKQYFLTRIGIDLGMGGNILGGIFQLQSLNFIFCKILRSNTLYPGYIDFLIFFSISYISQLVTTFCPSNVPDTLRHIIWAKSTNDDPLTY